MSCSDAIVRNAVVMILFAAFAIASSAVFLTFITTHTTPAFKEEDMPRVIQQEPEVNRPKPETKTKEEQTPKPKAQKTPRKGPLDKLYDIQFPKVSADKTKQEEVKKAFMHSWSHYKNRCYGFDEITPVSGKCRNIMGGGLFIYDSLSTLYIMNLTEDFEEAAKFVESHDLNGGWSMFEFIIRVLGGLISAYDLSHKECFKNKAVRYGDGLESVMSPSTGFYSGSVSYRTDRGITKFTGRSSFGNIAEVGTYQLEFMKLSEMTGDPKYIRKALKVYQTIWSNNPNNALVSSPYGSSLDNGSPRSVNLGAAYDSYYEYITKGYVLSKGVATGFLDRHLMAMDEIRRNMIFESSPSHYKGLGIRNNGRPGNVIEHLSTFLPGMFAVGSVKANPNRNSDLQLADEVVTTYSAIFRSTTSHLMPERTRVNVDGTSGPEFSVNVNTYILRPETAESIYVMWKFTGLQKYRDMAWELFLGINNSCYSEYGYSEVHNLNSEHPSKNDKQESFFLAETLKYLYLTFSDSSLLPPTEYVFNTEAHPFRIWSKETAEKFEKELRIESDGSMS